MELTPDVFQFPASVNEPVSMWKYAWITHCDLFIRKQFGGCCLQLATWSLSALFLALRKLCLWIQPFRYLDGLFNYTTGPVFAWDTWDSGVSENLMILNIHFLYQWQEPIFRISSLMCPLENIMVSHCRGKHCLSRGKIVGQQSSWYAHYYTKLQSRVNHLEVFHFGDVSFPAKQGQAQTMLDEKYTLKKCVFLWSNVCESALTVTGKHHFMIQIHPSVADRTVYSAFCRDLSWISDRKEDLALPV